MAKLRTKLSKRKNNPPVKDVQYQDNQIEYKYDLFGNKAYQDAIYNINDYQYVPQQQAQLYSDDRNLLQKGYDKVEKKWIEGVPESMKMFLPGVSDIEDAMYAKDQWSQRGNIGGKAFSAAMLALPVVGSRAIKTIPIDKLPKKFYRGLNVGKGKSDSFITSSGLDIPEKGIYGGTKTAPNPFVSSDHLIAKGFSTPNPYQSKPEGVLLEYFPKRNPAISTGADVEEYMIKKYGKDFTKGQSAQELRRLNIDGIYEDVFPEEAGYQFLNQDFLKLNKATSRKLNKSSDVGSSINTRIYETGGTIKNNDMANKKQRYKTKPPSTQGVRHNIPGVTITRNKPNYSDDVELEGTMGSGNWEYHSGANKWVSKTLRDASDRRKVITNAELKKLQPYAVDPASFRDFPNDVIPYDKMEDEGYLQEYGFGGDVSGFLKDNALDIGKVAVGAGLTATGIGGTAGIGLMASGATGMLTPEEEEVSNVYQAPESKAKQLYQIPAKGGLDLSKVAHRTDYEGNEHEQGGIPLGNIGVEVEDGESRTGDMIHSDEIKITKPILERYKDMVPLKKSDIGKSVADVLKRTDKKFERRTGDKWNDQAREATQQPFESMSGELSQIYDIAQDMYGNMIKDENMQGGGHLFEGAKDFLGDSGNAPIIGSGIGLATSLFEKPEEVDYQQVRFTPTKVSPIDSSAGIERVKRSLGNTKERLRRLNPRGYRNSLISMGAKEAEIIGDMSARNAARNAAMQNQAYARDAQGRLRTNLVNTQIGISEAEANAANRAALRAKRESYLNNLFTQAGQKSRDDKAYAMQEGYQEDYMDLLNRQVDLWGDSDSLEEDESVDGITENFKDQSMYSRRLLDNNPSSFTKDQYESSFVTDPGSLGQSSEIGLNDPSRFENSFLTNKANRSSSLREGLSNRKLGYLDGGRTTTTKPIIRGKPTKPPISPSADQYGYEDFINPNYRTGPLRSRNTGFNFRGGGKLPKRKFRTVRNR